jgi:hypothetical protein
VAAFPAVKIDDAQAATAFAVASAEEDLPVSRRPHSMMIKLDGPAKSKSPEIHSGLAKY